MNETELIRPRLKKCALAVWHAVKQATVFHSLDFFWIKHQSPFFYSCFCQWFYLTQCFFNRIWEANISCKIILCQRFAPEIWVMLENKQSQCSTVNLSWSCWQCTTWIIALQFDQFFQNRTDNKTVHRNVTQGQQLFIATDMSPYFVHCLGVMCRKIPYIFLNFLRGKSHYLHSSVKF